MEFQRLFKKREQLVNKLKWARLEQEAGVEGAKNQVIALATLLAEIESIMADEFKKCGKLAQVLACLRQQAAYLLEAGQTLSSIKIYRKSLSYCKSEKSAKHIMDRISFIKDNCSLVC